MEIPGDVFKPFIGLVNQTTMIPVGTLWAWKMSRMTMEFSPDKVDTPNNAFPDFATSIRAKRRCTGTISQASFDPAFNILRLPPRLHAPAAAAAHVQRRHPHPDALHAGYVDSEPGRSSRRADGCPHPADGTCVSDRNCGNGLRFPYDSCLPHSARGRCGSGTAVRLRVRIDIGVLSAG